MSTLARTSNTQFFIRAQRIVRFIPTRAAAPVGLDDHGTVFTVTSQVGSYNKMMTCNTD